MNLLKNGCLAFSTKNKQGILVSKNADSIKTNNYEQYLKGHSIHCLYEDEKNGLWVGTKEKGIYYCSNLENEV